MLYRNNNSDIVSVETRVARKYGLTYLRYFQPYKKMLLMKLFVALVDDLIISLIQLDLRRKFNNET